MPVSGWAAWSGLTCKTSFSTTGRRLWRCATWTPTTSTRRPKQCPARACMRTGASCWRRNGTGSTPSTWRCPTSAIQKGKHVYCQKPLCHDVAEVRALSQAAVKQGVVTQLGTQVAATIHDRTGVQWLKEGRIGKVTHAYLCSNRPGAIETYRLKGPRPAVGQTPPAY